MYYLQWLLIIALSGWLMEAVPLHATEENQDESAEASFIPTDAFVIQGLDKITARVFTVKAKLGQRIKFGSLIISAHKCFKAPPEEPPESVCFLEIFDIKRGDPDKPIFKGWMFASNPAASALEHPVYDVWIKEAVGEIKSTPPEPEKGS
jgi:hypothetical protein